MPQDAVPQLSPLETPIAVRPDYIAELPTTIVIQQREYTSLGRDYVVRNKETGSLLLSVKASSVSKSQRRTFEDVSGSPLFDLRRHYWSKAKHWYLYRPGESDDSLMTANIRWSMLLGLTLTVRNMAAEGSGVDIDVRELGWHGVNTTIRMGSKDVATMSRTAADGTSSEGVLERMSPKKRPIWTIHVAQGFDLSLAAVIGVMCAEHYPEYHFVVA
ncbi:hypothetical protein K431DRAFT_301555 [Polychaeton citri CBS 116435]|uniref:Tubby C-terminal domain-containing protein n=1 Tax=Polychaeton citri CBS 116435 TaxID=1314669 RepID=A0A9P4QEY8_9PEZI|nr:hypothetical protein K431DRAFT_301555 [Polychaeton citri CBS 116435]